MHRVVPESRLHSDCSSIGWAEHCDIVAIEGQSYRILQCSYRRCLIYCKRFVMQISWHHSRIYHGSSNSHVLKFGLCLYKSNVDKYISNQSILSLTIEIWSWSKSLDPSPSLLMFMVCMFVSNRKG
jgi:hypothetical protein